MKTIIRLKQTFILAVLFLSIGVLSSCEKVDDESFNTETINLQNSTNQSEIINRKNNSAFVNAEEENYKTIIKDTL